MIKVSFSWDDGALEDMKLMDHLLKLSIPSIFFIPGSNAERPVMAKTQIRELSENGFEIGAHTFSHQYLTNVSLDKAKEEIVSGKDFLEQITGQEINHFCFPGGRYNSLHLEISRNYFKTVRSADTGAIILQDSFLIKPAFQFYDRGRKSVLYNSFRNLSPIFPIALKRLLVSDYFNFIQLVISDLSLSENDYYINIWGHSWEIDENNLWGQLESFIYFLNEINGGCIITYTDSVSATVE